MKVSVIIPCYNAGKYLGECLDAVLAQHERDIEIIVVDDGSKDDTLAIAGRYAQQDSRVKCYHQENRGVSAARNLGLSKAQGEWIAFVDGDDLITPDALEIMLDAAGDEIDMVVCAHETFGDGVEREVFWPQSNWPKLSGEKKRRAVALRLIEGDSVLNIMCNKLHRRAMLEREGIRLTEGVSIAEDALFNLEAVLCGRGIAYVNRITYRYRMHAQSATQRRAAGEFDTHRRWLAAMRSMLERRGWMERFYCAYVDSVVLRLYKDGGIPGVVRSYEKARPLLLQGDMDAGKMGLCAGMLLWFCRTGAYRAVYPALAVAEILGRKLGECLWTMRAKKERPA